MIHSGAVGGGPRVVLDLATRVPGEHAIMAADDGPLLADARKHGIRTIRLPFAGKLSFAASIPLLISAGRSADLLHLHGQFAGFYGSVAARLVRVPALYTAHFPSFLTDFNWHNRLRNHAAELVTCRLSAVTVACSETNRREYLARRLISPSRIITIYNGVSDRPPDRSPETIRAELDLEEEAPVVLAMGRFTDQKGFDLLLEAAPAVLRDVPSARFVLAGDGERRCSLERLAADLGVAHAVRFTGFRRDTENLLAAATVVAAPSRYESSGLVVLEAMMAERPVVVSDLPVLLESVIDGDTGVAVPPGGDRLSAALVLLLQDGGRRRAMGRAAGERARERFGVERMANEYGALYQSLLGGSR